MKSVYTILQEIPQARHFLWGPGIRR